MQPVGRLPQEMAPLSRDAVVEQVRRTPDGGVCVISAPPGYGRRTVVALATTPADLLRFDASAPARDADPAATAGAAADAELRTLLGRLDAGGGGWLHLDGVDPARDAEVGAALPRLLVECPRSCRIVITTERELGALLAEVRLAGRLVEVDQADLGLSPAEAHELLSRSAPELTAQESTAVVALCDGWPAALLLAGRRRASHPQQDVVVWLRTRGAELLLGPWLDGLEPAALEMLVSTAFLDVLHPELVDAVLPGTGAGATLLRLAHHPGPVRPAPVPSHEGRLGYLRHPLLTERLRTLGMAGPGAPEAHARAAAWLRRHGDLTGELENLFAAGRHREAAERLYAEEEALLAGGRADLALRWYQTVDDAPTLDSLSTEVVQLLRRGWAQALSGDVVAARSTLGRLDAAMTTDGSRVGDPAYASLEGEVLVLATWLAHQQGDLDVTGASARRAAQLFAGDLSRNSHQLAPLYLARTLTLLGRLAEADAVLESLRSRTFALGAVSEGARAEIEAELAWEEGRVHECRAWAARRARWAASLEEDTPRGHRPPVAQWLAEAEAGRAARAVAGIRAVLAPHGGRLPAVTDEVVALVALCEVHRGAGQYRQALAAVDRARTLVQEHSPNGGLLERVVRAEARVRLYAGDPVRAERLLRTAPAITDVLLLRIRLGLLRANPVGRQMVREVDAATPREVVELAVLSAWAQLEHSRTHAEQDLLRAAEVAAAHGMTTSMVGVPPQLLRLARATAQHFVDDALLHLVEVAEAALPPPLPEPLGAGAPRRGAGLSRGELQLAPLLPTRMSNADIAEHLGVSVNTVKTRLRRLFAKLGVTDRRGAALRVAELGLVGPGSDPRVG